MLSNVDSPLAMFFTLGGLSVSCYIQLQQTTVLSSSEAEYMALMEAVREAFSLRQLLSDLGLSPFSTIVIHEDTTWAIAFTKEHYVSRNCKHIDVRHF
eukprot:scaffold155098_cov22-Prasinocladus_malaysianus.AAC.1